MQRNEQRGFVGKASDVEGMDMDGGANIRWLITHKDGAENFSMRVIEIAREKHTPAHSHDYEHEVYVVEGSLKVTIGENTYPASKDHFIFIPPNVHHSMEAVENTKIICVVPMKAAREILGD